MNLNDILLISGFIYGLKKYTTTHILDAHVIEVINAVNYGLMYGLGYAVFGELVPYSAKPVLIFVLAVFFWALPHHREIKEPIVEETGPSKTRSSDP